MTEADRKGAGARPDDAPAPDARAGDTLESFVAQLHDEGVAAGRREAERLVREAREQASEIVARARAEADAILAEAVEREEAAAARARADLELAARDAVLQLRAALSETLTHVLRRAVSAELNDPEVVGTLLREVVRGYARADAERRPTEIRLPRALKEQLERWWMRELASALQEGTASLEAAPLLEGGFEYRVAGGTVEVSVEATVEKLLELVRPRLREIVVSGAQAANGAEVRPGLATAAGNRG